MHIHSFVHTYVRNYFAKTNDSENHEDSDKNPSYTGSLVVWGDSQRLVQRNRYNRPTVVDMLIGIVVIHM